MQLVTDPRTWCIVVVSILTRSLVPLDHSLEIFPVGDVVVGKVALGKVQEKLAKVRTLNYVDRLYGLVRSARISGTIEDELGCD